MDSGRFRRDWATVPNAITMLRLVLVVPIAVLIIETVAPALTLALLVVFGASDWIDGYLARKLHQASRVGAILDPIADRFGVAVIVLAFVLAGHLHLWIVIAVAAVDISLAVAYALSRPESHPPVSTIGKIRTAILMAGIALVGLGLLPHWNWAAIVGHILCIAGATIHVAAGAGYLRALTRPDDT